MSIAYGGWICSYTKSGEDRLCPAKRAKTFVKDRGIDFADGTREKGTDLLFKGGRRG